MEHFEKRKNAKKAKQDAKEKGKKKGKKQESEDEDEGEDEEAGFDVDFVNFKDRSSWTALHFAANFGSAKICEVLIEAGADQSLRNSKQMVKNSLK